MQTQTISSPFTRAALRRDAHKLRRLIRDTHRRIDSGQIDPLAGSHLLARLYTTLSNMLNTSTRLSSGIKSVLPPDLPLSR